MSTDIPSAGSNEKGEEIDFGADSLRAKAENQAKLHKLVAELQA